MTGPLYRAVRAALAAHFPDLLAAFLAGVCAGLWKVQYSINSSFLLGAVAFALGMIALSYLRGLWRRGRVRRDAARPAYQERVLAAAEARQGACVASLAIYCCGGLMAPSLANVHAVQGIKEQFLVCRACRREICVAVVGGAARAFAVGAPD